ncbi:minor capsid protein [Capybara microvirus Cap1_SP_166]|nr:minor capsid protein [Capybara microvirus Cap1_SP_166]
MVKMRSAVDFPTNAGSAFKIKYTPHVNEDGTIDLVESEKINLQAEIDSHFDEVDMNSVMQRFGLGDTSAFSYNPLYGDTTVYPKTYAEMLQLQMDVDRYFMQLPTSIKEAYHYDKNQFFADIGSERWNNLMNPAPASPESPPEVITNES